MNSLKKITSILILLTVFTTSLVSCFNSNGRQIDIYRADVEIVFATNDDSMKAAVDAMNSSAVILVSGDDMQVETTAEIGDISVSDKYVLFYGTLYHEESLMIDGKSTLTLEKADITEEDCGKLLLDVGAGADIDVDDFTLQDRTGDNGNYTYTCASISANAKDSLEAIFASKFQGTGATVELDDAEYVIETEGSFNKCSTLSCHFSVTVGEKTYEITMHINTTYDYSARFGISFPINPDDYKTVSYKDIVG